MADQKEEQIQKREELALSLEELQRQLKLRWKKCTAANSYKMTFCGVCVHVQDANSREFCAP